MRPLSLSCVFAVPLVMGCSSKSTSTPTPETVGDAEELVTSHDGEFTQTQVCEDYELAVYLLALVQPPVVGVGNTTDAATLANNLAACPGTYSGLFAVLKQRIAAIHDYHTAIDTGDKAIDGVRFSPTVTSCDTPALCGNAVGSKLLPLYGGDDRHLYAHAARSDGSDLLFEIDSFDGMTEEAGIAFAKSTEILGLAALGGSVGREMAVLDARTIFDGRDRAPVTAQAHDLVTGAPFTLTADFVTEPSYVLSSTDPRSSAIDASYPDRSYGCVDTAPDSDATYGACLTDQGRIVVWLGSFEPSSSDPDIVALADGYLDAHLEAAANPVFLDVRGNGGGSLTLVTRFLCTFGDDDVLAAMNARRIVVSYYPSQFTLSSGRVVTFGQEIGLDPGVSGFSGDAITRDDPTFSVSTLAPDPNRRTFTASWWDLAPSVGGSAGCVAMRDTSLASVRWVVGTMGPEFSATEDTLSLLAASPGRFLQVGSITRGGTGNPDTVTLPNTHLLLQVAKERQMDGQGHWIIEDLGVAPGVTSVLDLPADFERRTIDRAAGQDVSGSAYSDVLFRTAEAQTVPPTRELVGVGVRHWTVR